MTGFKATNADMTCNGHQFKLGEWSEIDGEIKLCSRGFHFCVHQSGPLCYYSGSDSRVFKIEAEQVLDIPVEPGAEFKLVAKRIRLVEEIKIGGHRNTGDRNTGHSNTGHSNTGDRNTGDGNTGHWNTTNFSTGFFCQKEPKVISFDVQTKLTRDKFFEKYPEAYQLGEALQQPEPIAITPFKRIPGITKAKLAALHKKHLEGRKAK